jgi:hypothetical protein
LCGLASEVTILFPWGSLLRGVLGHDTDAAAAAAAAGAASLVADGGRVVALVSLTDRDGVGPLDPDRIAGAWRPLGFGLASLREATEAEVAATRSTWARRLGVGRDRLACRLELRRLPGELGQPPTAPARIEP